MNAYKNSIREYGWLSFCSFKPAEESVGEGEGRGEGLFPHPRPTPWISNRRRAARSCMHFESAANRDDAFRETLYSSEMPCIRSFLLFFFSNVRGASHFSKRAMRSPRRNIRRNWKGWNVTQRKMRCFVCRLLYSIRRVETRKLIASAQ